MSIRNLALLLLVLFGGCRPADQPAGGAAQWRECRLPKLAEAAQCTTVAVPMDRDRPGGPTIDLHIARLPAVRPTPKADPLLYIAGGPGQGASRVAWSVLPSLQRIRRDRDLIFVDVRGTGRSKPLDCRPFSGLDEGLSRLLDHRLPVPELDACRSAWPDGLHNYRTRFLVDDLEQVAERLGWRQVNLYGISYGSRAALAWLARHPQRIRSVVLDGAAPFQMRLFEPFARDAQTAWEQLVADCAADAACAAAFPSLPGSLRRLLARFAAAPQELTTEHPITGRPLKVQVTRGGIALAIRGLLYSADLQALLPLQLRDALAGDLRPMLAQTLLLAQGADESTSLGMMLSVVCSEDVDRMAPADLSAAVSGTFLGPTMAQQARQMCDRWPRFKPEPALFEPVQSDVPVLLLSGALDPVTPARWAEVAARTLSRSHHLVVPGTGHGAGRSVCSSRIVANFVAAADPGGLDADCLQKMKRPPFFLQRAGSAP